jgi:hypothetical protein
MSMFNCSPVNRDLILTTQGGKLLEPGTPSIPNVIAGRTQNHRRRSDTTAHFILLKNNEVEGFPHNHCSEYSKDRIGIWRKVQAQVSNVPVDSVTCISTIYHLLARNVTTAFVLQRIVPPHLNKSNQGTIEHHGVHSGLECKLFPHPYRVLELNDVMSNSIYRETVRIEALKYKWGMS